MINHFKIDTIFYALTIGEIFPVILLGYFMKETKGLSLQEKFELYRRDCDAKIEDDFKKEADDEADD